MASASQPRVSPPSPVASTSKAHASKQAFGLRSFRKSFIDPNCRRCCCCTSSGKLSLQCELSEDNKEYEKNKWRRRRSEILFNRGRMMRHFTPFSSQNDNISINGIPQSSSSDNVDQIMVKLDETPEDEDISGSLVQSIHDTARTIELSILEHQSSLKSSWFSASWLGLENNSWVKPLSYQAAVDSFLLAAIEISSRGDQRDRDVNVFVQRSLARLHTPLETSILDQLSTKLRVSYESYWSNQQMAFIAIFTNLLEKDPRFRSTTVICCQGEPTSSSSSDVSLLILALSCLSAIIKLGSAKLSCQQFFSMVPDTIGRFMDKFLDFVSIGELYESMKDLSLHREFLNNFGPRAAVAKYPNELCVEEMMFWTDLVQNQLRRAVDREKIWSRLTTSESIEVLEKDLAIFGFFIALGRSTQKFLSLYDLPDMDDSIEGVIRYLIGGSVLYYPQLSSISSYQLYVEVVCEELEWLPFYQQNDASTTMASISYKEQIPSTELFSRVLDVCSYWMTSFIKYSKWFQNPSNIKAAKFLARGHDLLRDCREKLGIINNLETSEQPDLHKPIEDLESELDLFDRALESVDEALLRLENLLQELHLCSSNSGKEHLKAACSDLEKIRKLKKEAEFLEASFRAKAEYLEQVDADGNPLTAASIQRKKKFESTTSSGPPKRLEREPRNFWGFLVNDSTRKNKVEESRMDQSATPADTDARENGSNDITRFAQLRNELIELERRVQRTTRNAHAQEENDAPYEMDSNASGSAQIEAPRTKNDNVISKSLEKIKETTTDVLQGTQLLAVDTAAATFLLKRSLIGDELTEKEKKALQRTLTDLASVVPIGILMLLPVTAVGHAAILAFIQRYVPGMIPSTYAPERLDLLRQLEKVKEMERSDISSDERSEITFSRK